MVDAASHCRLGERRADSPFQPCDVVFLSPSARGRGWVSSRESGTRVSIRAARADSHATGARARVALGGLAADQPVSCLRWNSSHAAAKNATVQTARVVIWVPNSFMPVPATAGAFSKTGAIRETGARTLTNRDVRECALSSLP